MEGDSLLHYPFCPVVHDDTRGTYGESALSDCLWIANSSLSHFLLSERVRVQDLVGTALWRAIIFSSSNSRRAAATWPSSTSGETLRARLRLVCTCVPCAVRALEGTLRLP